MEWVINGDVLIYSFCGCLGRYQLQSKKRLLIIIRTYQMNQETPFSQQQEFHLAYDSHELNKHMISFNQQQLLALHHIIQSKQIKEDAAARHECTIQSIRNNKQTEKIDEIHKNAKQDKKITVKKNVSIKIKRKMSDLMAEIDELDLPDQKHAQNQLNTLRGVWFANRGVLGF